jgi:peptidoglycan/LPS O-acetylase OafA/YrhL
MLRTLTALRFPAALTVFLWHAPLTRSAALPLSTGYIGVSFFFLLSGFILAYNYRPPFSLRRFYVARVARIYPVHLCGMLAALVVLAVFGGAHWSGVSPAVRFDAFVLQLTLLQSWTPYPDIHFGINGPAWSLSDEAFFYAMFPLAALAISRAFAAARPETAIFAAAALWALLVSSLAGVHAAFDEWSIYIFPAARFADFAAGMLLGIAFRRTQEDPRPSSRADPLLLEVSAIGLFFLGAAVTAYAPQALRFSAAMMPFSAALIFIFALQRGPISKLLSARPLVRLGEASYAFYVVHLSVILAVSNVVRSQFAAFAIALGVSAALSLLIFRYAETPLRRGIRERFASPAPEAVYLPTPQPAQTILPR